MLHCKPKVFDVIASFLRISSLVEKKEEKLSPYLYKYLTFEAGASVANYVVLNGVLGRFGEIHKYISNELSKPDPDPEVIKAFSDRIFSGLLEIFALSVVNYFSKYVRDSYQNFFSKKVTEAISNAISRHLDAKRTITDPQAQDLANMQLDGLVFSESGIEVLYVWMKNMVAACIAVPYLYSIPSSSSIAGYRVPDFPLVLLVTQLLLDRVNMSFLNKSSAVITEFRQGERNFALDERIKIASAPSLQRRGYDYAARGASAEALDSLLQLRKREYGLETGRIGWNVFSENFFRLSLLAIIGNKVLEKTVDVANIGIYYNSLTAIAAALCLRSSTHIKTTIYLAKCDKIEGFFKDTKPPSKTSLGDRVIKSKKSGIEYKCNISENSPSVLKMVGFTLSKDEKKVFTNFNATFFKGNCYAIICPAYIRSSIVRSLLQCNHDDGITGSGKISYCMSMSDQLTTKVIGVVDDGFCYQEGKDLLWNVYFPVPPPGKDTIKHEVKHEGLCATGTTPPNHKPSPEVSVPKEALGAGDKSILYEIMKELGFGVEGLHSRLVGETKHPSFKVAFQVAALYVREGPLLNVIIFNGGAANMGDNALDVLKEKFPAAAIIIIDNTVRECWREKFKKTFEVNDKNGTVHVEAQNDSRPRSSAKKTSLHATPNGNGTGGTKLLRQPTFSH